MEKKKNKKKKKPKFLMFTEEEYLDPSGFVPLDSPGLTERDRQSIIRMMKHPIPYELVKKIYEEKYELIYR